MIWTEKTARLRAWFKNFIVNEADLRGKDSEDRVFRVTMDMLFWNELPANEKGVYPYRTERWSELDMAGVDIVVPTKEGDIYIQVKSSSTGWLLFVNDKRSWDKICVNGQHSELDLWRELTRKIPVAYRHPPSRS